MPWNQLQYISVIFDGISIVGILIIFLVKHFNLKAYVMSQTENKGSKVIGKVYRFWHFWSSDAHLLTKQSIEHMSENEQIKDNHRVEHFQKLEFEEKGMMCSSTTTFDIEGLKIEEGYQFFTAAYVSISFFVSCYIGVFIHFLPCFTWTCDWSTTDNAGVRGGIWFGLWGIIFILSFTPALRQKGIIISQNVINLENIAERNDLSRGNNDNRDNNNRDRDNIFWLSFSLEEYNQFINSKNEVNVNNENIVNIVNNENKSPIAN